MKTGDRQWSRELLKDGFSGNFYVFLGFAVLLGVFSYYKLGQTEFLSILDDDLRLVISLLPRVVVAILVAALIWVLIPRDRLVALVGRDSGMRGLIIATVAGTVTPGGPSSAYSLLALLAVGGADRGALIAYITAWATLGLQRILIWDVPFMGAEFALLRFTAGLSMPIMAGLIARRIPFTLSLPKDKPVTKMVGSRPNNNGTGKTDNEGQNP